MNKMEAEGVSMSPMYEVEREAIERRLANNYWPSPFTVQLQVDIRKLLDSEAYWRGEAEKYRTALLKKLGK